MDRPVSGWWMVLVAAVTVAVAVAFADSSIVVLARPDLYAEFGFGPPSDLLRERPSAADV